MVTPKDCSEGFYCPNGTETRRQYPCPIGTYSNTTNLENEIDCRSCPPGHYCEATNITEPTDLCDAGYHCIIGSSSPQPNDPMEGGMCPQGTWCERGWSNPTPCPKVRPDVCGRYESNRGKYVCNLKFDENLWTLITVVGYIW